MGSKGSHSEVAQHLGKLGERLHRLGFVTGIVAGGEVLLDTESPTGTEVQSPDSG
jgi:hypothetical protein